MRMSLRSRQRQARYRLIQFERAWWRRYQAQVPSARYPGPCVCGHAFDEHHNAIVFHMTKGRPWVAEECQHFGSNETGGLGPDGRDHCQHYRPLWGKARRNRAWDSHCAKGRQ
jgi:hypothetical protein